jgi:hypothetical protein
MMCILSDNDKEFGLNNLDRLDLLQWLSQLEPKQSTAICRFIQCLPIRKINTLENLNHLKKVI